MSTRRPRLLILSFSPIVRDARVLKQVRLFAPDYDVTTLGYGERPDGVVEHLRIPDELLSWRLDRTALILRRFRRAQQGQEVVRWAREQLTGRRFDVVLADDAETLPLAVSLHPDGGVHADLHEYAPRQKEGVPRWRAFVAPYVRWLCRTYLPQVDSVTTVAGRLAAEYTREFGVGVEVVTNATPLRRAEPRPVHDPLLLVHSGASLPDRHLERTIEAMGLVRDGMRLDLYLTRNDPAHLDRLREQAARIGPDRVRVLDPVPYEELVETLAQYDVGVFSIPPVSFNYANTLPNKLFDFVQARLAVVVSPSPEMADVVHRYGLGLVTEDYSARSLAETLDRLEVAAVQRFKAASHAAAEELSAQEQLAGWRDPIDALAARSGAPVHRGGDPA